MPPSSAALVLILLVSTSGTQAAVAQASPRPGSRVRVSVIGERTKLVGTLQEQSSDSLVVSLPAEGGVRRTIRMDQVAKIEAWTKRRKPVGKGWAAGTAMGALTGALIGAVAKPVCEGESWCFGPQDTDDMIKAGVAGGAVVGGLIGAIVGASLPSHRWVQMDFSVFGPDDAGTRFQAAWRVPLPQLHSP